MVSWEYGGNITINQEPEQESEIFHNSTGIKG